MRKITVFFVTIFTVATLFAAARPSLDGRAVVAESGTMPKGLFARTVGYLPGDSVSVTNPATGSTIDVLILGAIDPSEGVAILLSPEAAEGLRIKPDSNVQVKLTKRVGSLDENANGSAVLSENDEEEENVAASDSSENESLDRNETPSVAENEPSEVENTPDYEELPAIATFPEEEKPRAYNTKREVHKAEIVEETPAEETPVVPSPVEESPSVAENTPDYEEIPVVAENTEEYEETPVSPEGDVIAETPVEPEEPVLEKIAESAPAPKVIGTVYEELPPLPGDESVEKVVVIEGEAPVSEETLVSENPIENASDEPYTEELVLIEPEISEDEAVPVNEAEKVQPVIIVETEKENADSAEDLQPIIEELPSIADSESEPYYEEIAAESESEPYYEELPYGIESEPSVVAEELPVEENDVYQPIILVEADMNPPAHEDENLETSEKDNESEKIEESAVARKNDTSAEIVPSESVKTVAEESVPVVSNDWQNYVVPSVRNLRSGYYYVQVASLGNAENIKNIVDKYSSKYPLVLVQNGAKTAYQVMVGPLNIDEYGSVDEKFKSYGFKDSFVRKIR